MCVHVAILARQAYFKDCSRCGKTQKRKQGDVDQAHYLHTCRELIRLIRLIRHQVKTSVRAIPVCGLRHEPEPKQGKRIQSQRGYISFRLLSERARQNISNFFFQFKLF